jgi:hypothetical protein
VEGWGWGWGGRTEGRGAMGRHATPCHAPLQHGVAQGLQHDNGGEVQEQRAHAAAQHGLHCRACQGEEVLAQAHLGHGPHVHADQPPLAALDEALEGLGGALVRTALQVPRAEAEGGSGEGRGYEGSASRVFKHTHQLVTFGRFATYPQKTAASGQKPGLGMRASLTP